MLQDAIRFAQEKHGGQMYGEDEYFTKHIMDCLFLGMEYDLSNAEMEAIVLHDTLEDTDTTYQELAQRFGEKVARLVESVTDDEGETRKERKKNLVENVLNAGSQAIKLIDRISNINACVKGNNNGLLQMYLEEDAEFRKMKTETYVDIWNDYETLIEEVKNAKRQD